MCFKQEKIKELKKQRGKTETGINMRHESYSKALHYSGKGSKLPWQKAEWC